MPPLPDPAEPDREATPGPLRWDALVRGLINSYVEKLAFNLTVPALPLDLKVQKVEPQADGLKITAEATNVALNSAGL